MCRVEETPKEAQEYRCFGAYDSDDIECQCCDSKKGCEKKCKETMSNDGASKCECFGSHISDNKKSNLCVYEKECVIETKEKMECFGKSYGKRPIIICGLCKYKERCEVLTKHE